MPRSSILPRRALAAVVALASLAALTLPSAVRAEPKRHHVTLGFGYQFAPDDEAQPVYAPQPIPVWGLYSAPDFVDLAAGTLSYRYAVSPRTDLVFDARRTFASEDALAPVGGGDAHYEHTTTWLGPGARFGFGSREHRLYLQMNMYFAEEKLSTDPQAAIWASSQSGVGFGLHAGLDIHLSSLLTLPVEMSYMTAMTDDGMSHVGLGAGLTFAFGTMP